MTSNDAAALEFAHRRAWAAWLDKNSWEVVWHMGAPGEERFRRPIRHL